MKLIDLKIMRGPNYWSNYRHQLIVLRLDLEDLEDFPTNKINGFSERLEALIPSLYSHRCSEGHEGGFFERVKEGTWMGHVIEHVALELQWLAGMECGYGRTRSTREKGIYHVTYAYQIDEAGIYAGKAAIAIAEKLIAGKPCDINNDIEILKSILKRKGLGPTTMSIIKEARQRGIPFRRLSNDSLILLGQGIHQKKIRASITSNTSSIGVETACDKEETKQILSSAFIPVPGGEVVNNRSDLKKVMKKIGFPLVVKPINGNHGRGITINIQTEEAILNAYDLARNISKTVIVERYIEGNDYRFLVINFRLVAVAKRTPAMVMGDGVSSIGELIAQTNKDPLRGEGHEKVLTTIKVDKITEEILKAKNFTLQDVLPIGEILFLKDTANISTGGTSTDVTDKVHPSNVFMAERVARLLNLDICGIDVVARDIAQPIDGKNGVIIEVNACPGLRMHLNPSRGLARNVAEPIVNMLFPREKPSRIPVVAVTGTNGKTTTTRLTAHIARVAGRRVGFTTTDGIYIQNQLIYAGDCTGRQSAETVLNEPTVDFAVLECARGGILRSGLGFDHCDISIITNITADHLNLQGIQTLDEMAQVKGVVARSTFDHGYSVLNADDDLVFNLKQELDCNIALFSIHENNERVKEHCAKGGLAAIIEKGYLTVCKGEWKVRICKISAVPLSFSGRAEFMIRNILPAVLTGVIQNFEMDDIRHALQTFVPSPEQTPGRLNIFHFRDFDVMIDYAHNPGGFTELKKFLSYTSAYPKVGIIAGVGDRRDEDIRNLGEIAAETFDEIIIRHDKDLRGRTKEEFTQLLTEGIRKKRPDLPVTVISDELEALQYAMDNARPGAFITTFTDSVKNSIAFMKKVKEQEEGNSVVSK
ncbi:MAG: cyanophycin synthetase [Bacteroidia bacterium]